MAIILLNKLLPLDSPKRVGIMYPKYITIHETELGEELSPNTYCYEYYQKKLLDNSSSIGYHFMVEANHNEPSRIYQFLETSVSTHHCGHSEGNSKSLGIERLVNVDTDMERAIDVQAKLTALLMLNFNIPIENIKTHNYWNPKKLCPNRLLVNKYGSWNSFINKIQFYLDNKERIENLKFSK